MMDILWLGVHGLSHFLRKGEASLGRGVVELGLGGGSKTASFMDFRHLKFLPTLPIME